MLRLAFDFIITWRETRTRPNAYKVYYQKMGSPIPLFATLCFLSPIMR